MVVVLAYIAELIELALFGSITLTLLPKISERKAEATPLP